MIIDVINENQLAIVESLAREIWTEYYTPFIGSDQVNYMLDKFQSRAAIAYQIKSEGYLFYLIEDDGNYIGYLGVKPNGQELFLSKLYVHSSRRGQKFGKKAIRFLERLALKLNLNKVSLTVNKKNTSAIMAYKKLGFKNLGSSVVDIGNGFIMDDFKMEKYITFLSNSRSPDRD